MSRDFAVIMPSFWTGDTGVRLRGYREAQILALYLMSSDQTCMTGIFKIAISTMSKETGIGQGDINISLSLLSDCNFLKYDHDSEVVWVENLTRFQVGEHLKQGDTKRMSIIKKLRWASRHPFTGMFFAKYGPRFGLIPEYLELSNEDLRNVLLGTPYDTAHDTDPDQDLLLSYSSLNSKTRAKSKKTELPTDWKPSQSTCEWMSSRNVDDNDANAQVVKFKNYAESEAKKYANWDSAFKNWIENAIEWGHITPTQPEQPRVYFEPYAEPVNPPDPEKVKAFFDKIKDMGKSVT